MKDNEFKGSTVDSAIEKGLKKLELTREEVEIEVLNEEGIFTKALVRITPINPSLTEKQAEIEEENKESSCVAPDTTIEAETSYKSREKRERKEYFPEEKEKGKVYLSTIASYFTDKARVDAKSYEDEICFCIGGDDAKVFIGHRGETLDALQCLVSQYLNKDKEKDYIRVTVDANFYRERRKRILTALAKKMATQAYNQRREISLEPMNSYERRIIHSVLQNSSEASTRSEGEGKERHIVIVPKCEVMSYGNVSSEFRKKGPSKMKTYGGKKVGF